MVTGTGLAWAVVFGIIPFEDHIPGLAGSDVERELLERKVLAAGFQRIAVAADHQAVVAMRMEGIFLGAHVDVALHGRIGMGAGVVRMDAGQRAVGLVGQPRA